MMKIAPVSADLLIKLAIGAAALGAAWYVVSKGKAALSALTDLPGKAWAGVVDSAKIGGATWKDQYSVNPAPTIGNSSGYGGKYKGPLVNNDGYDFGQLSG